MEKIIKNWIDIETGEIITNFDNYEKIKNDDNFNDDDYFDGIQ